MMEYSSSMYQCIRMPYKTVISLFFIFISLSAEVSGQSRKRKDTDTDPAYIGDFQEAASARILIAKKDFNFSLKNKLANGSKINYRPNVQGIFGVGFTYRKSALDLSFRLPIADRENALFGKTKLFDIQINNYGPKLGLDFNLQAYRGFYVANPQDFNSRWSVINGYPQRPDISIFNLGVNAYYVFNNRRFSFRAAFNQTERQLQSAGSFLLASGFSFFSLRSDSLLMPVVQPYKPNGTAFEESKVRLLSFAPGYVYTLVIHEKFYITPSLFWGIALQRQKYLIDTERKKNYDIDQRINFRLAAGYYGNKAFAGIAFVTDNNRIRMENVQLNTSTINIKLFVGYRFDRLFNKKIRIKMLDDLQ